MLCSPSAASVAGQPSARRSILQTATTLRPKELPHLVSACRTGQDHSATSQTSCRSASRRDGRTHVFLYLVNRTRRSTSVPFYTVTSELLRALPEWELRLARAAPLGGGGAALRGRRRARSWRRPLRVSTTSPSFAGIFRQQDQSRSRRRARDLQRASSRVSHVSARRGITCSIGSGRRTATALERHGVAGTRGRDRAAERPCDERSAAPCLCPSLTPGWLGVAREIARNGGGNDRLGRSVPPPGAAQKARERASTSSVWRAERVSRMLLIARRVADAKFARRFVPRVAVRRSPRQTAKRQPGRERPPLPPPGPGPGPCRDGGRSRPGCVSRSSGQT